MSPLTSPTYGRIEWPESRRFAFTVFDDPDGQTFETTQLVYSFLASLGFRTTIAVWPMAPRRQPNSGGETCANPAYLSYLQQLQKMGFEIAFHHSAPHSSTREETIEALNLFENYFGSPPLSMANHYNEEALYWGPDRLTGWRRSLYNILTRGKMAGRFFGHVEGHPCFWGDVCHERIRYCRNFIFSGINTLQSCPWMPYADLSRPYVRYFFAGTEGAQGDSFCKALGDRRQDQLEAEGGACIMYTHFGHGFVQHGQLQPEFRRLMERLAKKNGWFVPTSALLDFLMKVNGPTTLCDRQRNILEARWLWGKLFRGTS